MEDEWCARICFEMPSMWRKFTTNPAKPKSIISLETISKILLLFFSISLQCYMAQKSIGHFQEGIDHDRPIHSISKHHFSLFSAKQRLQISRLSLQAPAAWPAPMVTTCHHIFGFTRLEWRSCTVPDVRCPWCCRLWLDAKSSPSDFTFSPNLCYLAVRGHDRKITHQWAGTSLNHNQPPGILGIAPMYVTSGTPLGIAISKDPFVFFPTVAQVVKHKTTKWIRPGTPKWNGKKQHSRLFLHAFNSR